MRSINKVVLIGNLTRDPEMRQTPNGQSVVTFGIATNREWITKDGRKQTSTEYHDLVAWAKLADICQKYLKKGKLVYVEGYLKTRSWDAPDGTKKFRTETVVQDMIMLDKRGDRESDDQYYPEEESGYHGGDNHNTEHHSEESRAPSKPENAPQPPKAEPKEEPVKEEEKARQGEVRAPEASQKIDIDSDLGL